MVDELMDSFWLKEKGTPSQNITDEEEKELLRYLENFKNGRFEEKETFVKFFTGAEDTRIYVIGMRIFMAIARHEDMPLLEDYLSNCEEEQLQVFLAYVEESLSCHVIPFLLSLLDTWDETYVAQDIAYVICDMIQYQSTDEEKYNIKKLRKAYIQFAKNQKLDTYYYCGNQMFLGDLTKKIMLIAMKCKKQQKIFYTDQIPSILSNSTGIGCPVSYGVEITDEIVEQLMEYIEKLAELGQERGHKYFYNHLVE